MKSKFPLLALLPYSQHQVQFPTNTGLAVLERREGREINASLSFDVLNIK